jgi:preprotein translocase subunit SecD
MKSKLCGFLAAVISSIVFTVCASTNEMAAAQDAATFQMRMVEDVTAGDCDCDDMVVVGGVGPKETLHVLHGVLLGQNDLKSVKVETDSFGRPEIAITFNANGAKRFAEVTRNNIHKRLAIIIEGKLYSAPVIRSEIASGNAVISGHFSEKEAQEMVERMNAALKK